jgi:hypothetical protein
LGEALSPLTEWVFVRRKEVNLRFIEAPPRGKGLGGFENWIVAKDLQQIGKPVIIHVGTDSQRSGSKNLEIAVAGSARAKALKELVRRV